MIQVRWKPSFLISNFVYAFLLGGVFAVLTSICFNGEFSVGRVAATVFVGLPTVKFLLVSIANLVTLILRRPILTADESRLTLRSIFGQLNVVSWSRIRKISLRERSERTGIRERPYVRSFYLEFWRLSEGEGKGQRPYLAISESEPEISLIEIIEKLKMLPAASALIEASTLTSIQIPSTSRRFWQSFSLVWFLNFVVAIGLIFFLNWKVFWLDQTVANPLSYESHGRVFDLKPTHILIRCARDQTILNCDLLERDSRDNSRVRTLHLEDVNGMHRESWTYDIWSLSSKSGLTQIAILNPKKPGLAEHELHQLEIFLSTPLKERQFFFAQPEI